MSLVSSLALFARIFEYLDLPVDIEDPPHPVAIDPAEVRGDVRFEAVTFAYPGSDRNALTAVDLDAPALPRNDMVSSRGARGLPIGSVSEMAASGVPHSAAPRAVQPRSGTPPLPIGSGFLNC